MKIKNVLSLFDGMSGGQIALNRAGIKYENYYACEIDKYAIIITQNNYPNTIQLGDVTKVFAKDLPKIDLLIGGSPCQGFSFAGKQLNFEDQRSKLFFEFVRLLNELKPKYFLLENVRMKKEYEIIISRYLNVEPILINSSLVSAQNRERLYWTNIHTTKDLFGLNVCNIPQPKNKNLVLKDILQPENEIESKYYLSEKALKYFKNDTENYIENACIDLNGRIDKNKTGCLTARYANGVENYGSNPFIIASRGRGDNNTQQLEPRHDGKTNTLTTVQKDNFVFSYNQDYQNFESDKTANCLRANAGGIFKGVGIVLNNAKIRKLTPIECERLQTVPDNYTNFVSNSRRYHALGNGWTIDVIVHIFNYIPT